MPVKRKRVSEGRFTVSQMCFDGDVVGVAREMFRSRFGAAAPRLRPKTGTPAAEPAGRAADWVLAAGRRGSRELKAMLRGMGFGAEADSLARGRAAGYGLSFVKARRSKAMVLVGSDRTYLLEGLAHVWAASRSTGERLVCSGGELDERPAFAFRYYWTWDHSTNWWLDAPGQQDSGCCNRYTKPSEAYFEDYRRLVDSAVEHRANGVLIWGFLRDAHGGVEEARRLCDYANSRGVAIIPGVGTSAYGGSYYEGDHPFNVATRLAARPELAVVTEDGNRGRGLCPSHPDNVRWLVDGVKWLYDNFAIGGVNLENGDFQVCQCDRCRKARRKLGGSEPDFFKDQLMSYEAPAGAALAAGPGTWVTYATYTGFKPETAEGDALHFTSAMGGAAPLLAKDMPEEALAQWTLTGMVHETPVPLEAFLDDGTPRVLAESIGWPRGLRPPTARSTGFLHQASQSYGRAGRGTRYSLEISAIKEGCMRAAAAGLEGISIHGEVSSRCVPYALNYLAFSHFTFHPRSSLGEFAWAQLAPRVGGAELAGRYVEMLAAAESGRWDPRLDKDLVDIAASFTSDRSAAGHEPWDEGRFWRWLAWAVERRKAAPPADGRWRPLGENVYLYSSV